MDQLWIDACTLFKVLILSILLNQATSLLTSSRLLKNDLRADRRTMFTVRTATHFRLLI
jgi:hypothetical protein